MGKIKNIIAKFNGKKSHFLERKLQTTYNNSLYYCNGETIYDPSKHEIQPIKNGDFTLKAFTPSFNNRFFKQELNTSGDHGHGSANDEVILE